MTGGKGVCPSFIQFGYATPELVQRMQIYDAYDRCGYVLGIRIEHEATRVYARLG